MNPSPDIPILWHFRVSHYNEKVRWALDLKKWPHVRRAQLPGLHIPVARWVSGQNMLPILKVNGRIISGSNHILAELERICPNPPLFPAAPDQLNRALAIQAHFDEAVAPDLRRLFWSTYIDDPVLCAGMVADGFSSSVRSVWRALFPAMRPLFRRNMQMDADALGAARRNLLHHFDHLAREIGPSGYLVGEQFSVADLTAAAVMTAIVRPAQFPYPLPEPWPSGLLELWHGVEHHPAFQWVLDIYARHRSTSMEVVARQAVAGSLT